MVTLAPEQTFADFLRLVPPVVMQRLTQVKEPFPARVLLYTTSYCSALSSSYCSALSSSYYSALSSALLPVKGGNYQLSGKVAQSLQSQSTRIFWDIVNPVGWSGLKTTKVFIFNCIDNNKIDNSKHLLEKIKLQKTFHCEMRERFKSDSSSTKCEIVNRC